MLRGLRDRLDLAGRRQIAYQLGKLESEVTDEDIEQARAEMMRTAIRRAKRNFAFAGVGIVVLVIIALIV